MPHTGLRATEQPIDTSTAAGKCFLDMLGMFAEFETNLRRERQLEGIAKAKAAGAAYALQAKVLTKDEARRIAVGGTAPLKSIVDVEVATFMLPSIEVLGTAVAAGAAGVTASGVPLPELTQPAAESLHRYGSRYREPRPSVTSRLTSSSNGALSIGFQP